MLVKSWLVLWKSKNIRDNVFGDDRAAFGNRRVDTAIGLSHIDLDTFVQKFYFLKNVL